MADVSKFILFKAHLVDLSGCDLHALENNENVAADSAAQMVHEILFNSSHLRTHTLPVIPEHSSTAYETLSDRERALVLCFCAQNLLSLI